MNKLVQTIEKIRQRLPELRRHSLNETSTRTIVIDPLLESLGWDVRDPDEVQLEYPTVDGKSVDYALKLNKKPVLLVEAKPLGDTLDDVKAVTQVVGYAANNGIVWCILTNGIKWRVYRSMEKCPAPDKLMYEVSLDPTENEGMTVRQIAVQMWRFSSEEMAKGTLDALGEQTFTDGKVRKALQSLMADPTRPFINLVRKAAADDNLSVHQIKESMSRIAGESVSIELFVPVVEQVPAAPAVQPARPHWSVKSWETRRARSGESPYDESHHISGKPREAIHLYRAIDRLCLSFSPGGITKRYLAKSINYECKYRCFCSVVIVRGGLRLFLKLKYSRIEQPPSFARDVSNIGHWGTGDLELRISNRSELDESAGLIRRSFESVSKGNS
ncbi:MAG: DUF5655 domain-containing protein [bacterium]